jgi:DNA invertase Pin-like site-specific DNA recombinase
MARPVMRLTVGGSAYAPPMTATQHHTGVLIGYARCSTARQDLTAQRELLEGIGVAPERIYLDHGLTGTTRARPGLDQALAAVRADDTLVVPKLDRLARSVPDVRAIGDQLVARGVKLQLGGQLYDPTDPLGKLFFNILATFAEFEADLARLRTREGMAIARARGKLKGKPPKLSARQQAHLLQLHGDGKHTIADLAELFSVSRATVYRVLDRARATGGPTRVAADGGAANANAEHQSAAADGQEPPRQPAVLQRHAPAPGGRGAHRGDRPARRHR